MPTYDYVCDACGHAFEQWQSFHDDHLTKCPTCKKNKLRRLIGMGAAIVFKGSGFYETDYNRDEKYQAAAKADAAAPAPAAETKPDATPAASTDAKPAAAPPAASTDGSSSGGSSKPAKKGKKDGK